MKTIFFMFLVLLVYLVIGSTLGYKWSLIIFSINFFIMATLFLIKKEYYYKYLKFTNPKYIEVSNEKSEEFKSKNRITNIICWYIMSGLFMFQGIIASNNRLIFTSFGTRGLVLFIVLMMIVATLIWLISIFALKKSKTNSAFVGYSILIGIVITIAFIGIIFSVFLR